LKPGHKIKKKEVEDTSHDLAEREYNAKDELTKTAKTKRKDAFDKKIR